MDYCIRCHMEKSDVCDDICPECQTQIDSETEKALTSANPNLGTFRGDVDMRRVNGNPGTNVPREIAHHSPTGFEWGYGGSGPADLALNILHQFLPPGCDGEPPVNCHKGQASQVAFRLHQEFKWHFLTTTPTHGARIAKEAIWEWLAGQGVPTGQIAAQS